MPSTPAKKAWIIEKFAESPTTQGILVQKGIVMSTGVKKQLLMRQAVIESVAEHLGEVKAKGGVTKEKNTAHQALTSTSVGVITRKYQVSGPLSRLLHLRRPINKERVVVEARRAKKKARWYTRQSEGTSHTLFPLSRHQLPGAMSARNGESQRRRW